jgi:putative holliday junction resolvase
MPLQWLNNDNGMLLDCGRTFAAPANGAYSILLMCSTVSRRGAKVPETVTSNANATNLRANEAAHRGHAGAVLAVDYGRRRIGLAISDELELIARPLKTIHRENRRKDLQQLRQICRQNAVAHIIVGHPLHMSGQAGEMATEAEAFANRLSKAVGVTVELVDERLTSWEARQTMARTKPASRRTRESLDDIAAAVLLRAYLERKRGAVRSNITETD